MTSPEIVGRNAPCPCGSKRKAKKCCYRPGDEIRPLHAQVSPPHPATGYAHPKCYLRATRNCSERISREHVISQGILNRLTEWGRPILEELGEEHMAGSGMPSQSKGEINRRSVASKVSKILCDRHNTALAPLDSAAVRLLEGLKGCHDLVQPRLAVPDEDQFWLINGHDIERWMLKSLIGFMRAGWAREGDLRVPGNLWEIGSAMIEALLGNRAIDGRRGLYLRANRDSINGEVEFTQWDVGIRPLWDPDSPEVIGASFRLFNSDFVLWLDELNRHPRPDLGAVSLHPHRICAKRGTRRATIEFAWEGTTKGGIVDFLHVGLSPDDIGPNHRKSTRWRHWGHEE